MSGITSGVGPFSGIDTGKLIDQLLSVDARPKTLAQNRIKQLQLQQTSYLDLNSRLSALKSAAQGLSINRIFDSAAATSSNTDVLTASATPGAASGTFNFLVDRLVSSQQVLSKGFSDKDTLAIGASPFVIESAQGRLDRDTSLSELNGGQGVQRGKINITDAGGTVTSVDLSRAETIGDVIKAINGTSGIRVNASVRGGALVLTDNSGGGGTLSVANATGSTTATSLGLASLTKSGATYTGAGVRTLGASTALSTLNDGLGVGLRPDISDAPTPDFTITAKDGTVFSIDVGASYKFDTSTPPKLITDKPAATDLGTVVQRINAAGAGKVTASIDAANNRLVLNDTSGGAGPLTVAEVTSGTRTGTTARDLGILGSTTGTALNGRRLIAGLNSTLLSNVGGGAGVSNSDLTLTGRNGSSFTFSFLKLGGSVSDLIDDFNADAGNAGRFTLGLNANGTGLTLTDKTGGSGNLVVSGALATELGLNTTGVAKSTLDSKNLQHRWINENTSVASLNFGRGIGTGSFEIIDPTSKRVKVDVGAGDTTLGKVIQRINDAATGVGAQVRARINDNGDGIVVEEAVPGGGSAGGTKIQIADLAGGTVASGLNLVGTASATGSGNKLDGSYEKTVKFDTGDSLTQMITKINNANTGVVASIVSDGSPVAPYRLQLSAKYSGLAGAFTVDTGATDFSLSTLSEAKNARVFVGADDPAKALLYTSTTNSVTGVLGGVTLTLKSVKNETVSVNVARDTEAVSKAIADFVKSFNDLTNRIDSQSTYDATSNKKGPLLGDSTAQGLRSALYATILGSAKGVTGQYKSFAQIGITVGRDGNLTINQDQLNSALAKDFQGVADVVSAKTAASVKSSDVVRDKNGNIIPGASVSVNTSGTYTSQGVAELIGQLADSYVKSESGLLTRASKTIDEQIKGQNDRITNIQTLLDRKKLVYTRQFAAMEEAIAKLQSQSGSVGSIKSVL